MNRNAEFRSKFYEGYFSRQASRSGNEDLQKKIKGDHAKYQRELGRLLPPSREAKITDLGCGYGSLLLFLKNAGYNAHGIDASDEQVEVARSLGVSADVGDIVEWARDFGRDHDRIFAIDLIEHFDKPELLDILTNLKEKLKPGGQLIMRTPNLDAIRPHEYAYGDFTHGALLNPSSAVQLMYAAGYRKAEVLPSSTYIGGAKEPFRKILWAWFSFCAKLKLFASGRSTRGAVFTPNIIIVAEA